MNVDDRDVGNTGSEIDLNENTGSKKNSCSNEDFSDNNNDENNSTNENSAHSLLKDIKIKNTNRIVIGSLNINSISSKFD